MPEFPVSATNACVGVGCDRLDAQHQLSGNLLITPLVPANGATIVLHGVEEQESNRCRRCRAFRSRCFPWIPQSSEGCVLCQDPTVANTSNALSMAPGNASPTRSSLVNRPTPANEWLMFINDWSHERIQVPTHKRSGSLSPRGSNRHHIHRKTLARKSSFEGHVVPRNTVVFAIDLSLEHHERLALGAQLLKVFDAMSDSTLIGLVVFGKAVMVYELEARDPESCVRVDVFSGQHSPRVDVEQRQMEQHECRSLLLAGLVDSPNGPPPHQVLHDPDQDESTTSKNRYVAFKKTCAVRFRQVISNLMAPNARKFRAGSSSVSSARSVTAQRTACCAGVALEYATLLSKYSHTNAGHVVGFLGETCTFGPGKLVSCDSPRMDPIALDAIHGARGFYQQLGDQAVEEGVTLSCFCCGNSTTFGAQAIDEAVLKSNGLLCRVGSFEEPHFHEQLHRLVLRKDIVTHKICMRLRVSNGFCIDKVDGPVVCVMGDSNERGKADASTGGDGAGEVVVEAVACDANFSFQVSFRPVLQKVPPQTNGYSLLPGASSSQQMCAIAPISNAKCFFQLETHYTNQHDQSVTQFVTLGMPVTSDSAVLYRSLDVDTTCGLLTKQIVQMARKNSLESARSVLEELVQQLARIFAPLQRDEVGISLDDAHDHPQADQFHYQDLQQLGPELVTCFAQLQRNGVNGFVPKRLLPLIRSLLLLRRSPLLGEKFASALEVQPFLWHLVLQSSVEETGALAYPVLFGFGDLNNPREEFQVFPLLHSSLQSTRLLCLDHFTDVFIWEGSQAKVNPELYEASKQVLLEYATSMTSNRLLVPRLHVLQEGTFWSRCLETRLIVDHEELFPVAMARPPGLLLRLGSWLGNQSSSLLKWR